MFHRSFQNRYINLVVEATQKSQLKNKNNWFIKEMLLSCTHTQTRITRQISKSKLNYGKQFGWDCISDMRYYLNPVFKVFGLFLVTKNDFS